MARVKVSASVDADLWNQFKEVARKLYGGYGAISRALDEAIMLWLQSRGVPPSPSMHTSQEFSNSEKGLNRFVRVARVYEEVKRITKILLGLPEDQEIMEAPGRIVREAVKRALMVTDDRTIDNWLERFRIHGLLCCVVGEIERSSDWRYCRIVRFIY